MMRTVMLAAAVLCLAPSLSAQVDALQGSWVIIDAGTGQQLGTLQIQRRAERVISVEGSFPSSAPGGLPPSWMGAGTSNERGGQFSWMSFDGREGRTTINVEGDRLRLQIRCERGTCTGGEFTYVARRATAPVPPAPPAPVPSPPAPSVSPAPVSPTRRAWQEVRSTEGRFRVEFPGVGAYVVRDRVDRMTGSPLKAHEWGMDLDNGWTAYIVGFTDLPQARVSSLGLDGTLADAVKGGLQALNGTLVSETPIIVSGYPAHEFVITATSQGTTSTVRGRAVLVGLRLYNLVAVSEPKRSRLEPGEVERFLNSFQVIR